MHETSIAALRYICLKETPLRKTNSKVHGRHSFGLTIDMLESMATDRKIGVAIVCLLPVVRA